MRILVIGGTRFLGRHLVEAALERGHEVTLFNRGKTNAGLFPSVTKLRGDRNSDLRALQGQIWDIVIDTCGYVPRVVSASAQALAHSTNLYVFISSISVYPESIDSRPEGFTGRAGISREREVALLEEWHAGSGK